MSSENIQAFLIGAGVGLVYILRKREPFATIWAVIQIFFTILLFILMLGFVSNSVKSWWKK